MAFAEEKPAASPAATALAGEEGIAVAKREFDAVKSARGVRDTSKLDLGSLSTPELHLTGAAPQALKKPGEAEKAAKKKSANWLLDGVAEQKKRDSAATGDREKEPGEGDPELEKLLSANRDSAKQPELEVEKKETKKPAEAVVNPLDQYMAGWMTQQDFSLLKPTASTDGANGLLSPRNDGSLTFGAGASQAANQADTAAPLRNLSGGQPGMAAPRENPFLAAFSPPPAMGSPATPGAMATPPPVSVFQAPPPPAPVQKPVMPDFVKPRNDDKYYKQMKRF